MVKRPYEGNCHIKDWQRVQDTDRSGPAGIRARRRSASVDVRKPLLEMHGHRRARRAIGPCRSVALGTAGRAVNKSTTPGLRGFGEQGDGVAQEGAGGVEQS